MFSLHANVQWSIPFAIDFVLKYNSIIIAKQKKSRVKKLYLFEMEGFPLAFSINESAFSEPNLTA